MNKKIYLVKKDPTASKSENEWIQMSGSEFYSFIKCILRRSAATGAVTSGHLAAQRPPVIRWSF